MRDIHIGKRGSATANEEQRDQLRRTVRFEQEAPNTSSPSTTHVSFEYPASERQVRPEPVLVQTSGHVDDDIQISALGVFYEMDGRESRYIKEVLAWYREEDTGDSKKSELNELVESMTCRNALEVKSWKCNQNIVMDEEFVKHSVTNEEFVESSVMDAKIDSKVVMDLPFSKLAGGTIYSPAIKFHWTNLLMRRCRGC